MQQLPVVAERSCGSCDLCCRVIGVSDGGIEKPAGVPCEHLCNSPCGQCGIYAERPSACQQYTCMWLDGQLPIEAKPEHSGVVAEICHIEPGYDSPPFSLIVVVSRSQSELHVAIDRWFRGMVGDSAVVIGFVPTVDPETPEILVATTEGYRRVTAFMDHASTNGVMLASADGLHLLQPG